MTIKTPAPVESPYQNDTNTPTTLTASPALGGGVTTTTVAGTTSTSASGGNISYYATGIEGVAGLANQGAVFSGANVNITLEEQQYITQNKTVNITGNGTVGGSNGQIQFNDNGLFAGSSNLTFDGANVAVSGVKTDNYYYANGAPFSGGGGSNYGNSNVAAYLPTYSGNLVSLTGPVSTTGNVTANIAFLHAVNATANVTTPQVIASGTVFANNISSNNIFNVQNLTTQNAYVDHGEISGDPVTGDQALYVGQPSFTVLGTDVMAQFTGNVGGYGQINFQNFNNGNTSSGDYIITADNGNDTTKFLDLGLTGSNWDGSETNVIDGLTPNNGYLYVQDGNLTLGTRSGNVSYTWNLDTNGNLTIPNGGYINFVNTGGITQAVNEDLRFTVSDDEEDGWAIQSTVNDGAGNDLTRMQVMYDGVAINTDIPTNNYRWDFRDTGEFDVPKSIRGPVGGNLVISIGDQLGSTTFIDLQTRSHVGDALLSNIRIGNPDVTVSTASGVYNWTFGGTGNLTLPPSSNIVGATANNSGRIQWLGNSSGDGAGYTTLGLIPDDTLVNNDQYLIIDPTAPGHIHIRAGGTQDNSSADLFLGGENSYFKVNAGANNEVRISANSYAWVFGADSTLTVPNEGVIRSIQDTVVLQSVDVLGNTYSARLGTNGGLYLETTEYANGWLYITNNSGNANIDSPSGNINIKPAFGVANGNGKSLNLRGGDADQSDYYTGTGGAVNITGGLGGFNDGGGGGPGGSINITAGLSADPAGVAGNVTISSGNNYWQFINNGNLYVPGQINGDNNGSLIIDGSGSGEGFITLPASAFGGEQVSITNQFLLGNGIALTTNGGTWHFGNSGVLTTPGSVVFSPVPYANLTAVAGARAFINDGNLSAVGNFGQQVIGGASNTVPVWSDGTNWYIG